MTGHDKGSGGISPMQPFSVYFLFIYFKNCYYCFHTIFLKLISTKLCILTIINMCTRTLLLHYKTYQWLKTISRSPKTSQQKGQYITCSYVNCLSIFNHNKNCTMHPLNYILIRLNYTLIFWTVLSIIINTTHYSKNVPYESFTSCAKLPVHYLAS